MRDQTVELFHVNSDIIGVLTAGNDIGWKKMRESSIHRIIYLSGILYAFIYKSEDNKFKEYHFSLSPTGPYSETINRSMIDLKVRELVIDTNDSITLNEKLLTQGSYSSSALINWFKIVLYILGLYGEDKIFGFVIQDPQYKSDFKRNSKIEIDLSDTNKTVEVLNQFKAAFEESLDDVSMIDDREYLELYFEYVFSKIIKRED